MARMPMLWSLPDTAGGCIHITFREWVLPDCPTPPLLHPASRLLGELATRALLRRCTAAWASSLHWHTSKSHRTLGCAVLEASVAELSPDVLPSAAAISGVPSSTRHSVQDARRTAEAVACGRPFPTSSVEPASDVLCCCIVGIQKVCAAALPHFSVLCRATLQMPAGQMLLDKDGKAAKPLAIAGVC